MDSVNADTLVKLARANAWIPLIAIVVGTIIRLSKNDPLVARVKFYIKPQNRAAWAMVWAVFLAALDRLATGGTWYDAIAGGFVAGCTAIAAHEVLVNGVRKGRDFGVKKQPPPPAIPPPDWADDSLRPEPKETILPTWPKIAAGGFMGLAAVSVTIAVASCVGARGAVCPIIDLASQLCPLILVKLPDGSEELVPRDRIADAALRVRLQRMRAAEPRLPLDPNPYRGDGGGAEQ
jgi:hypothetical protein